LLRRCGRSGVGIDRLSAEKIESAHVSSSEVIGGGAHHAADGRAPRAKARTGGCPCARRSERAASRLRLIGRISAGGCGTGELTRRGIQRIAKVSKPLLVIAVVTHVPVVISLVDVALVVILLNLTQAGELAVELRLQGRRAVDLAGSTKDVLRVLAGRIELVLELLLGQGGVAG
jgi:hypothetical protein